MHRRRAFHLTLGILALALVAAVVLACVVGAAGLSAGEAVRAIPAALTGRLGGAGDYPDWAPALLRDVRLPRIALAVLTGAALSAAGASFQGVFRNPLADPYLLGISAGAGLGATIAILFRPLTSLGFLAVPAAAFVGAVVAAMLVYRLGTFSGHTHGASLLLSGIAVGSSFTAGMSFLMVATEYDLRTVVVWLMGGFTAAGWTKVAIVLPVVVVGLAYLQSHSKALNLLLMGEERARQLGLDGQKARRDLLIVSSLMTAAAVAFSGLIGFIGLMVPHIMRLVVGPDNRLLLPVSALFGAVLLLVADTVARTALAPAEIPVGIITAATGGPFFLYLLRMRRGV